MQYVSHSGYLVSYRYAHLYPYIGVGRCSDLGGGDIVFKQQKYDFLEEQCLHAIRSTILQ